MVRVILELSFMLLTDRWPRLSAPRSACNIPIPADHSSPNGSRPVCDCFSTPQCDWRHSFGRWARLQLSLFEPLVFGSFDFLSHISYANEDYSAFEPPWQNDVRSLLLHSTTRWDKSWQLHVLPSLVRLHDAARTSPTFSHLRAHSFPSLPAGSVYMS